MNTKLSAARLFGACSGWLRGESLAREQDCSSMACHPSGMMTQRTVHSGRAAAFRLVFTIL